MKKEICKQQTLSNWSRRPLRENQLHYAAMDAFCLINILDVLKEEVGENLLNYYLNRDFDWFIVICYQPFIFSCRIPVSNSLLVLILLSTRREVILCNLLVCIKDLEILELGLHWFLWKIIWYSSINSSISTS